MNHKYKNKKIALIVLFILLSLLNYLIINSFLSKDIISPRKVSPKQYIKVKLSNI